MTTQRAAVRAVQATLALKDPTVRIDGIAGPQTRQAFKAADPNLRGAIVATVEGNTSMKVSNLLAPANAPARAGALTEEQLRVLLVNERRVNPFARSLTWLTDNDAIKLARIESGLVPTANNGRFYGLYAMGRPAWADAQGANKDVRPFDTWADPESNIRAAMTYWGILVRNGNSPRLGLERIDTVEKLYAAHQQGHAGFTSLVKSRATANAIRTKSTGIAVVDNQSVPSLAVVATAVTQARGTRNA